MKKIITLTLALITTLGFSQMALQKIDGTPINDGDVFNFTQLTDPGNYLGIKIFNNSLEEIRYRIKVVSITNATGSSLQLCFANVCFNNITAGNSYPNLPFPMDPESSTGDFDHFLNNNAGTNLGNNVEYVFKFYQVNLNNVEVGNTVTITYRYTPLLSANSFAASDNLGVQLKSSLVSNQLELQVSKPVSSNIFDLNGKLINSQKLSEGIQNIDVTGFNSGIYLLNLTNDNNQKSTVKFIKN